MRFWTPGTPTLTRAIDLVTLITLINIPYLLVSLLLLPGLYAFLHCQLIRSSMNHAEVLDNANNSASADNKDKQELVSDFEKTIKIRDQLV